MLLYISHPCTTQGDINENRLNAKIYTNIYKNQGYHVINPLEVINSTTSHEEAMKISIKLLKVCDAIAMCGDWEKSKGCVMEYEYAKQNGIEIIKEISMIVKAVENLKAMKVKLEKNIEVFGKDEETLHTIQMLDVAIKALDKPKPKVKKSCFAYTENNGKGGCRVLDKLYCRKEENCSFYKTEKQLNEEVAKAEKRLNVYKKRKPRVKHEPRSIDEIVKLSKELNVSYGKLKAKEYI